MVKKIKALCQQSGISIAALEKNIGLGNGTISKWETSSPQVDKLLKVANFFNVSVEYLLSYPISELTKDAFDLARKFDALDKEEQGLIKCYLDIVSNRTRQ